jgi:GTPase SAR1 family protein
MTTRKTKVPLPNVVIVHIIEYASANIKNLIALELTSRFCRSVVLRDAKTILESEVWPQEHQNETRDGENSLNMYCEFFSIWQACFKNNFDKRYEWLLKTYPSKTPNKPGKDPTLHIDAKRWKDNYKEELRLQDFESQMLIDTSPYAVEHHYLALRKREIQEYERSGKYYVKPNVLVLGDVGTGKSAFVRQYVHGQFYDFGEMLPKDYLHSVLTRDDIRLSNNSIDYVWLQLRDAQNAPCLLEPVNGKWPRSNEWVMCKSEVLMADAVILLFDITRSDSYNTYVHTCIKRIMAWKNLDEYKQFPIVLVANKCDLKYWELALDMTMVKKEVQEKYEGAYPLLEISCKSREEVDNVIKQVIKTHRHVKKKNGFAYSNHSVGTVQKITGIMKIF